MDAISSIGNMFSGGGSAPIWQTLLKLGSAGAGTIGNIIASTKRNQVLNQSLNNQKQLMDLSNNPAALAKNISGLERPLSAGLTSGVGNAVQAYLAERGLSQAPGIQSETLAQGLAPYQQQEQQMAINAYLQTLGLPAAATPRFLPYPQSTDLSKLFQSLFNKPNSVPFGTWTPSTPSGIGVMDQPSMSQLTAFPADSNTGSSNTSGFDWMSLLNGGGFNPSPSLVAAQ